MSSIAQICSKETLVRSSYYSDTYRCRLQLDEDNEGIYDVVHISLPFAKEKESELLRSCRELSEEKLKEYYIAFEENIYHGWKMEDRIHDMDLPQLKEITDHRIKTYVEEKTSGKGKDIYAVYPVKEAITDEILTLKGTTSHNLLNMTKELIRIAGIFKDNGLCAGHFEVPDIMAERNETGISLSIRGLRSITFIDSDSDEDMPFVLPENTRNVHPEIVHGTVGPSYYTDIYSAAVLLFNMLAGRSWMTDCLWDIKPMYASERLMKKLLGTAEERPEDIEEMVRNLIRAIDSEKEDTDNRQISFKVSSLGPVSYIPEQTPADVYSSQHMEEYDDDDYYYSDEPKGNTTQTTIIILMILGVVLSACFVVMNLVLPSLRSNLIIQSPEEKEQTVYIPIRAMSSQAGLYSYNGMVSDAEGRENSLGYILDSEGNIVKKTVFELKDSDENVQEITETEIIYTADEVSRFVPVSRIRAEQTSSEYISKKTLDDYSFTGKVTYLLDHPFIFNDTGEEMMEIGIPDYIVAEKNIASDAVLLVYTGTRDDPGTGLYTLISDGTAENGITRYYCRRSIYEDDIYEDMTYDEYESASYNTSAKNEFGTAYISSFESIYTVTVSPEAATCRDIEVSVPDNREVYLFDEFGNRVKYLRLGDTSGSGIIDVHLCVNAEEVKNDTYGELVLNISSVDRAASGQIRIKGNVPPEHKTVIKVPAPTPVMTPVAMPSQSPISVQTAAPVQSYTGGYGGSGYIEDSSRYILGPFGVEPTVLYLSAGSTDRIYTAGDDGGYISVYSTDPTVALAAVSNDMDGSYTVRGENPGECDIVFESVTTAARCHVYVN